MSQPLRARGLGLAEVGFSRSQNWSQPLSARGLRPSRRRLAFLPVVRPSLYLRAGCDARPPGSAGRGSCPNPYLRAGCDRAWHQVFRCFVLSQPLPARGLRHGCVSITAMEDEVPTPTCARAATRRGVVLRSVGSVPTPTCARAVDLRLRNAHQKHVVSPYCGPPRPRDVRSGFAQPNCEGTTSTRT